MWPNVSVFLIKKQFLFIQEQLNARKSFWKRYPLTKHCQTGHHPTPPHLRRKFLEPRMVCFHKYDTTMWPNVSVFLIKKQFLFIQEQLNARKSFWKRYPLTKRCQTGHHPTPPHLRRKFLEPRMVCFHKYDKANNKEAVEMMQACLRKPVFGGLWITKTQTRLRISAVWSAPLLFVYRKVFYLDLLWANISLKPRRQVLSRRGPAEEKE